MASNGNNGWAKLVLAATIFVYIVYFAGAAYTFQNLAPIPVEVKTTDGTVLFTYNDIIDGKYIVQRYGIQDYGSILGFGGYFGTDYTAYALKFIQDAATSAGADTENLVTIQGTGDQAVYIVDPSLKTAYDNLYNYYKNLWTDQYVNDRLALENLLTDDEIRKVTAYFMWTGLIAIEGYTNGFPYAPGLVEQTIDTTRATWVTIFLLLLVIMPMIGYIIVKFIDYWKDERITVSLPTPSATQRVALLGMVLAALGLLVQGLLGGYMMHLYAEPTLYGLDTTGILPFNVARGLHYNLAILWIAVTWVSFALFVLPYFGLKISKGQATTILLAGGGVAILALLGLWASYLGKIPDPLWFIIGSQGRPVVSAGTLWLLLIAGLVGYLAIVTYKVAKQNQYPFNTLLKILAIGLGGTAFGAFIGALPIISPWKHFTVDEYFRWITIHAFVEGFWPAIVIPILLILLVIAGLVPPRLAVAVAGIDATLEIATGMIGTAHHYYWGGEPTFWMYLGAAISTLEVLPIGFVIAYALVLWKKGEVKTELQKTILTFILVAAFGGAIGVVAFGAGLINMPIVNYYLHGTQATMVHAHLAMPLAYGVPTILMWVVAFYLAGGFGDATLAKIRKAIVVAAAGFYLQVLLSLGVMMYAQFDTGSEYGYWYVKSLVLPDGTLNGFWMQDSIITAIWARMIGDVIAGLALILVIYYVVKAFPKAFKAQQ
ncbi:MAG: cbb3-type cytochrome c oxidase subunit I [Desulfurococcales archaeon]|nr:cbb3-type cytochrome c oxidase subunit I [Desulfurococcales archaeon]